MIRLIAMATVGVIAFSACGEAGTPEHAALVGFCRSDGGKQPACTCAADRTVQLFKDNRISPDMFRALVLEAEGKADEAEAILQTMSIDEKFAQVTAIGEAKAGCDEAAG